MSADNNPLMSRVPWIEAFLAYIGAQAPAAPQTELATTAAALYARFGEFEPIHVAEAEWDILPLGGERFFDA